MKKIIYILFIIQTICLINIICHKNPEQADTKIEKSVKVVPKFMPLYERTDTTKTLSSI